MYYLDEIINEKKGKKGKKTNIGFERQALGRGGGKKKVWGM